MISQNINIYTFAGAATATAAAAAGAVVSMVFSPRCVGVPLFAVCVYVCSVTAAAHQNVVGEI